MSLGNVVLAGVVAQIEDCTNCIKVLVFWSVHVAQLELDLLVLGEDHRIDRAENTPFENRMNGFHGYLSQRWI